MKVNIYSIHIFSNDEQHYDEMIKRKCLINKINYGYKGYKQIYIIYKTINTYIFHEVFHNYSRKKFSQ